MAHSIALVFLLVAVANCIVPASEQNALQTFYTACGGPSWTSNTNWMRGDPCDDGWFGVLCEPIYSSVISLVLPNNTINCPFPDFTALVLLQTLDLRINPISGSIPANISSLTQLTYIDFSECLLTGTIPPSLGSMTALEYINFGVPNFDFGDWTNRFYTGIVFPLKYQNMLTGPIPTEFGQLTNLKILNLALNALTGPIPDLSACTQLQDLSLQSNLGITGPIPDWLGQLTELQVIDLYSMGLNEGVIPVSISNCVKLQFFSVARHYSITGNIPAEFNKLVNLKLLLVGWMGLSGSIPDLSGLTKLEYFHAGSNAFTGTIPDWVTGLTSLQKIFLFSNQLVGELPSGFGSLQNLQSLIMYDNKFTGTIPESYANLKNLVQLAIHLNQFSGTIPAFLGDLPHFNVFLFNANNFTGEIPETLCNLGSALSQLVGSDNQLSGSIPNCLLTSLTSATLIQFQGNKLTGTIPPIGNLGSLQSLLLGSNKFDPTPSDSLQLSGLTLLTELNLNYVGVFGDFPEDICSLPKLTSLSLANNQFSGTIPSCITNTKLGFIDLSGNAFSGEFPNPPVTVSSLDLHSNKFTNIKTINFGFTLSLLQLVDLSNNSIAGPLEEMMSAFQRAPVLTELSYENNQIGGSMTTGAFYFLVPSQVGTATSLGFPAIIKLLLGGNSITGPIHPALALFNSLQQLDVSNNNLTGSIPALGSHISLVDFRENPGLLAVNGQLPPFVTSAGPPYVKDSSNTFSCPTLHGPNSMTIYLESTYYNNTLCLCEAHFYGSNGNCKPCLDHTTCPGGESPSPMIIDAGYWPSPNATHPLAAIRCNNVDPTSTPCNPSNSSAYECRSGYTGRLCSRCAHGFYMSGVDCLDCRRTLRWLPILLICIFAIAIYLGLILPNYSYGTSNIIRIIVFYIQTASLITHINFSWPSAFKSLGSVSSGFNVRFEVLKCTFTTGFTYYQQTLLVYFLPPAFLVLFLVEVVIIKVFKIKVKEVRSPDGKRRSINVTALSDSSFDLREMYENSKSEGLEESSDSIAPEASSTPVRNAFNRVLYAFLNLVSLVYLPATSQTINYFNCADDPYLGPYMDKQPDISCKNPEFLRYRNASIVLFILYGIGIPLIFGYLLFTFVRNNVKKDSGRVSHWFGFFYLSFKPKYYYYGLLLFVRSWLLLLILGFVDDRTPILALFAAIILVGAFLFHQNVQPLRTKLDNFLESLSLAGLIILFSCGLIFAAYSSHYPRDSHTWAPVLGILGTAVAIPPIVTAISGVLISPVGKYVVKKYVGVEAKRKLDRICKPHDN